MELERVLNYEVVFTLLCVAVFLVNVYLIFRYLRRTFQQKIMQYNDVASFQKSFVKSLKKINILLFITPHITYIANAVVSNVSVKGCFKVKAIGTVF